MLGVIFGAQGWANWIEAMILVNTAKFLDKKFSRLTVVSEAPRRGKRAMVVCRCDCGNVKVYRRHHVVCGAIKSCGCLASEVTAARNYKHGMSSTPTWNTWSSMRQRCEDPNHDDYPSYGGRGITVCERWSSFENFLEDMGEKPQGRSIDRIDNDAGYCKSNCRWATAIEQANNKTTSRWVTFGGRTQTLMQWARELVITHATLQERIARKWSEERILGR